MKIDELLKEKSIKPKDKTETISKWILNQSLPVDELIFLLINKKTLQKQLA